MTREQVKIGQRVKCNRGFWNVPLGTEAVIDELYDGGFMVAWDLPNRCLPSDYRSHDGFGIADMQYLYIVE